MNKEYRHKSFYVTIAVVGIFLFMLEVGIYRKTIIPFIIPSAVTLIVTVITFFIIQRDYKMTYRNKSLFFPFAQSFISFGFIACYLFMALNYFFADNISEIKDISILAKHTIGTGSHQQSAIEIDYEGSEKQLVFYNSQKQQLDTSKQVVLTVKRGFFGFDILDNVQLK